MGGLNNKLRSPCGKVKYLFIRKWDEEDPRVDELVSPGLSVLLRQLFKGKKSCGR